jgi:hypothetical protein
MGLVFKESTHRINLVLTLNTGFGNLRSYVIIHRRGLLEQVLPLEMQDLLKGLLEAHVGVQGRGWATKQITDFCLGIIVDETSGCSR